MSKNPKLQIEARADRVDLCPDTNAFRSDEINWTLGYAYFSVIFPAIKVTQRGGSFVKTILWKLACFVLQACTVRDFPPGFVHRFIITRRGGGTYSFFGVTTHQGLASIRVCLVISFFLPKGLYMNFAKYLN